MARQSSTGEARPPQRWVGPPARPVRGSRRRQACGAGWGGKFSATISMLCVVGLVLVGRAALAAHMLIVPHQVSGAGLLVHHVHGTHSPGVAQHVDPHSSATPEVASGDDGHDDYCEVMGLVETHDVVAPPIVASDSVVWVLPRLSPPPAVSGTGLPLLLLAPKQSPPRV